MWTRGRLYAGPGEPVAPPLRGARRRGLARKAALGTSAGDHGRQRARIVALTLKPPGAGTHWTTRDLAPQAGVSHGTVHRIWREHDLQPHRVATFKFTTDPDAEAKIHDVVGLYIIRRLTPSC